MVHTSTIYEINCICKVYIFGSIFNVISLYFIQLSRGDWGQLEKSVYKILRNNLILSAYYQNKISIKKRMLWHILIELYISFLTINPVWQPAPNVLHNTLNICSMENYFLSELNSGMIKIIIDLE